MPVPAWPTHECPPRPAANVLSIKRIVRSHVQENIEYNYPARSRPRAPQSGLTLYDTPGDEEESGSRDVPRHVDVDGLRGLGTYECDGVGS